MSHPSRPRKPPKPPLDAAKLHELALAYAARFATTRAKLATYLARKVRERGWRDGEPPDAEAIAMRMAELGYVDDAGYAAMKAGSLSRAGYGARRVGQALKAAGVGLAESAAALDVATSEAWTAAERFARKRRIGPFATEPPDRLLREKQIAAFIRAGHGFDVARKWVDAVPGEVPEAE